jgi:hypothetical protein
MRSIDARELAERYVALWIEPDAGLRRKAIEELWQEDGAQILHPPQEIQEAAAKLAMEPPALEARGFDALEARVARAYEDFVAPGEFTFRARDNAFRLRNVVKFNWEYVPVGGGDAVGLGLDVLVLGDDGRIESDYQFIES